MTSQPVNVDMDRLFFRDQVLVSQNSVRHFIGQTNLTTHVRGQVTQKAAVARCLYSLELRDKTQISTKSLWSHKARDLQRNSLSWIIISHQTHAPKSLSMQSRLTPFPDDRASISLPC
ncbi:hypothetical protein EYC80_002344 [Monilinia laxa]|uniref:Uncharacterized protein n=1 Tax=Monilinia laxa TaxID=61186 RepID=A0A5N6K3L5_MONLA|nr:hypothetical protein EYC80_002344 [Monilinia laxa]